MANKTYPNIVLQNKFEDQYNSKLDLMQFCTIDDSLEGKPGDKVVINTYTGTSGTEVVEMGQGNTKDIEVSYEDKEYVIITLQNRFPIHDEEVMRDENVLEKGLKHMSDDMYNTSNAMAMAEFAKATLFAEVEAFDFNAFVDGSALFNNELGDAAIFALVNPKDVAELRKNLKDDLKYVEAFVRTGYIGTVAGVSIYTSNIAAEGEPILATKKAVTYFSKKGTEFEQERDADKRKTTYFSRKYGIFAFTDATQAVKLKKKAVG